MLVDPEYQQEASGWNISERTAPNGYTEYRALRLYGKDTPPRIAAHVVLETAGVAVQDWLSRGYIVDHINRDPSDNRLENLRFVTHRVNAFNKPKSCIRRVPGGFEVRVRVPWAPKEGNRSGRLAKTFRTEELAISFRDAVIQQVWDWFYEHREAVNVSGLIQDI